MITFEPSPLLQLDLDAAEAVPAAAAGLSERLASCAKRALPHEMVQALTDMARCYAEQSATQSAEAYLEQALRWSLLLGGADGRADLLCEAAEVAACSVELAVNDSHGRRAARRRAIEHASQAGRLAAHVADPLWEIKVLLRASDVLDRCGQNAEASDLQARALLKLAACTTH